MTDALTFGRRTAALLAASCEHLPRVLDVTALGPRRELVLDEPAGPTLAALLSQRRRLTPPEAVTVVVSAVRAVAALHAAGYCGVALDEAQLRFDASGRPVVLGLDRVRETIQAGADGLAEDWRAVAALADRLGLVARGRAAGVLGPAHVGLGLALATVTAGESEQNIDGLETALFELAEPEPVRLDSVGEPRPEPAVSPLATARRSAAHRRPSSSVLIEAFDAGPAALIAGPLEHARSRLGELFGRVRGRARVLLIAGGAAAALTFGAVLLMPSSPAQTRLAREPARTATAPTAAATATATADPRLMAADPVAAASVLLAQRDGCLTLPPGGRSACLAGVSDSQASDLTQPARPLAGLVPSLIERSGDSALIALTPKDPNTAPASALLMRTEAGWRLRQLYEN